MTWRMLRASRRTVVTDGRGAVAAPASVAGSDRVRCTWGCPFLPGGNNANIQPAVLTYHFAAVQLRGHSVCIVERRAVEGRSQVSVNLLPSACAETCKALSCSDATHVCLCMNVRPVACMLCTHVNKPFDKAFSVPQLTLLNPTGVERQPRGAGRAVGAGAAQPRSGGESGGQRLEPGVRRLQRLRRPVGGRRAQHRRRRQVRTNL